MKMAQTFLCCVAAVGILSASPQAEARKAPKAKAQKSESKSSNKVRPLNQRQARAESFEKSELWQLAYIERLALARENPSASDLSRLGELALILGRFDDVGRMQGDLISRGLVLSSWPGALRAALAAYYLESGNTTAASQAMPSSNQIQNIHPRARIKAALISGAVAYARGRNSEALDNLVQAGIDKSADFSVLYLQRSRILYDMGQLTSSMEELTNVPRSSPVWYPGLYVSAWSSYRAGDLNLALGLLMSMHSPYLRDKFNPESYVLEASTLYRLCYFESALRSISVLKDRYKTMPTSLSRAERQLDSRLDAVTAVIGFASGKSVAPWSISEDDWKLVADGLLSEPGMTEVSLSLDETAKAEAFIKSKGFSSDSGKVNINGYLTELDRAKGEALKRGRRIMLSKIARMKDEAASALESSLAVEVEINSRIRERLASGKLPKYKDIDFDAKVNKGFEFWPYQGEYWRDEAGSYVFATSDVCAGEAGKL